MANLFDKAKPLSAPKKAAGKPEAKTITLLGLASYAAICSMEKWIKSYKAIHEENVKFNANEIFVATGLETGKRPESFAGEEGSAKASIQLRQRGANSPCNEEEVTILTEALGDTAVTKIDLVAETFVINPAYLNDSELMERVGNVLAKVKGMPEDFIMSQSQSKTVVSETALDLLFTKGKEMEAKKPETGKAFVESLLKLCGVTAIRPTIAQEEALAMFKDIMAENDETTRTAAKAKVKSAFEASVAAGA